MSRRTKSWLVGLTLLGAALRFHGLFNNSLGSDEALFATWARLIAVWQDPLLMDQIVDKPPLLFYLQAIFYPLFGAQEWAARMPNFIGSLLLIPTAALLGWRLYGEEIVTLIVAAFVAISPMAIHFSATGYTDPLLTFFLTASLLAIVSRKPGHLADSSRIGTGLQAGLLFGLAAATKYQAWLFLPLVIGLAIFSNWQRREWRNWLIGLAAILALVISWDLVRNGNFSLLGEQLDSYGGLRLAWSWELWPRFETWVEIWTYTLGSPVLLFILSFAVIILFSYTISGMDRLKALDLMLVSFLLGYFALHWILAIPTWDRYLLPVLPIVGLVLSRFIFRVINYCLTSAPLLKEYDRVTRRLIWLLLLLLIVLQAPAVYATYQGQLPEGANPAADYGAAQIARALEESPYGTVLYDHWYSWQWRYHLFDKKVYLSWFPGPEALIDDLTVFANRQNTKYLVLPNAAKSIPIRRLIVEAGFSLKPVILPEQENNDPTMTLYIIESQ